MITSTGREVFPGTEQAPSLFDIGNGLARMPRFAGQTKTWYPVLAHVINAASMLPVELAIYGLLHDAAESIVGDQVTTWKNPETKRDEAIVMERICQEHGIEWPWPEDIQEQVDHADLALLKAEAVLLGHHRTEAFDFAPFDADAFRLTAEAISRDVPWLEYGVGGEFYESAFQAAMMLANGASVDDLPVVAE
jgi:5'-deoxynucleotidase YfbR-like HD superfamily hydrolase